MSLDLDEARVYVGTYAKYNNGSIAGEWVDLSDFSDEDEFNEHIASLHSDEEDPEFMFQDYENIPSSMISESGLDSSFWELKDHDNAEAVMEIMEHMGFSDGEEAIDYYDNYYQGDQEWSEFAYDAMVETMNVPENILGYIDWEKWEQDLGYDYIITDSGHIFLNA